MATKLIRGNVHVHGIRNSRSLVHVTSLHASDQDFDGVGKIKKSSCGGGGAVRVSLGLATDGPLPLRVYHSSFTDEVGVTKACRSPLLPLKSHIKGPAPTFDQDRTDIVDKAITFFRADVFFRNMNIKSSTDKLLIYLTFYINVALKRLEGCRTLAEGTKAIINLGLETVPVPGEPGFSLPGLIAILQSQKEADYCKRRCKYTPFGRSLNPFWSR
ncbi:Actin- protein 2/3 complex subunit 3 [Dionaea muscipula]